MTLDPTFLDKARETEVHDETFAAMLAQSKAAFDKYTKALTDIEKQLIGTFHNVPAKLASWSIYRVGIRSLASTQALAHLLTQQGWVIIPPKFGVVMAGCEPFDGGDGANAIYLAAPLDTYKRMKAIEDAAANKRSVQSEIAKMDGLEDSLGQMGVAVETLEVRTETASLDEVRGRVAETRSRLRGTRE